VRVGWFKIAVRMLGCITVCRGVWPQRGGEWEGGRCWGWGPQRGGGSFTVSGKAKGVVESDTAYVAPGKMGGQEMCGFRCVGFV
jgi:hypothetical protein